MTAGPIEGSGASEVPPQDSPSARVARQSAVIFVLGWLLLPLQFVTAALVARSLGPERKGLLFLLGGLTAVVATLTSLGLPSAAIVLYKQKRRSAEEILGTVLLVTVVTLVVVALVYATFAGVFTRLFLGELETVRIRPIWIALALAAVLPNAILAVGDVLLISDDAMKLYAVRSLGTALVALLLTWALVFGLRWGVTGVLVSQPLAALFGIGVLVRWASRKGLHRSVRFSGSTAPDLLRIGVQQWGISLVSLVAKRFDGFLIATLLSVRDAGFYSVASSIQTSLVNLPRATMWPLVSSLADGDPSRLKELPRAARIQTAAMILVTLVSYASAGLAIRVLFGPDFDAAVTPTRWALLGIAATPSTICANALFTARGRPGISLVAAILATALQVTLNFVLVPRWGASGSALALTVSTAVGGVIQLIFVGLVGGIGIRQMLVPTRADVHAVFGAVKRRLAGGRPTKPIQPPTA